jgi:hypothetical protein
MTYGSIVDVPGIDAPIELGGDLRFSCKGNDDFAGHLNSLAGVKVGRTSAAGDPIGILLDWAAKETGGRVVRHVPYKHSPGMVY